MASPCDRRKALSSMSSRGLGVPCDRSMALSSVSSRGLGVPMRPKEGTIKYEFERTWCPMRPKHGTIEYEFERTWCPMQPKHRTIKYEFERTRQRIVQFMHLKYVVVLQLLAKDFFLGCWNHKILALRGFNQKPIYKRTRRQISHPMQMQTFVCEHLSLQMSPRLYPIT